MSQHKYKGITFAEGWNGTFEQFQSEFGNTHVFRALEPKEKLSEMKKVFQQVTKSEPKTADKAEQ